MVWEGEDVIATGRRMMGATKPKDSAPGTIRGDFAVNTVGHPNTYHNMLQHAPDLMPLFQHTVTFHYGDDEDGETVPASGKDSAMEGLEIESSDDEQAGLTAATSSSSAKKERSVGQIAPGQEKTAAQLAEIDRQYQAFQLLTDEAKTSKYEHWRNRPQCQTSSCSRHPPWHVLSFTMQTATKRKYRWQGMFKLNTVVQQSNFKE